MTKKLVAHVGQNIEEQSILQPLVRIHQAFNAEHKKLGIRDIRIAVEVVRLGSGAHGVQAKADVLENLLCIEIFLFSVVILELVHAELIEVRHDRIVLGPQLGVVGFICDPEVFVQLGEQNLDGVDLGISEVLICSEEILEESNMLGQPRGFPKRLRSSRVLLNRAIGPCFRFKRIDDICPRHEVDITAAECLTDILIFRFRVEADHTLPGLTDVGQHELHQVALALTGVAKDQDVRVGLVLGAAVEVNNNVAAIFVAANV